jgi:hypothetical protein
MKKSTHPEIYTFFTINSKLLYMWHAQYASGWRKAVIFVNALNNIGGR